MLAQNWPFSPMLLYHLEQFLILRWCPFISSDGWVNVIDPSFPDLLGSPQAATQLTLRELKSDIRPLFRHLRLHQLGYKLVLSLAPGLVLYVGFDEFYPLKLKQRGGNTQDTGNCCEIICLNVKCFTSRMNTFLEVRSQYCTTTQMQRSLSMICHLDRSKLDVFRLNP